MLSAASTRLHCGVRSKINYTTPPWRFQVGNNSARIAAMKSGAVSCAPVSMDQSKSMTDLGLNLLIDLSQDKSLTYPAIGVGVTVGEGDSVGDGDAELLEGEGDELDGEGDAVGRPPTNC